jgi:hypothetical protein
MLDNMTVNQDRQVISLEDRETTPTWPVSINTTPLAGIWLASASTTAARFEVGSPGFITQDEESSGAIPAPFLGAWKYLIDVQNHKPSSDPSLSKVDSYSYCKSRLVRPSRGDPSLGGDVPGIAVGRVAPADHPLRERFGGQESMSSGLDGPGSAQSGLRLIATGGRPMRQVSSRTKPIRCPLPSGDGQRHPWTEAKVDTRNPERGPLLILREACDPAECPGRRNWH